MTRYRRLLSVAALSGALALAGCRAADDENQTNVAETNITTVNETSVVNVTETEAPVGNTTLAPPPTIGNADAAQVQEDADAVGMTAHVDRNQSAPQ